MLKTLFALKQKGNSLVVVEHDEDTLQQAEYETSLVASKVAPEVEGVFMSAMAKLLDVDR